VNETKYSPLPWQNYREHPEGEAVYIDDAREREVAVLYCAGTPEKARANAALIVRAVNNHDRLLAALQLINRIKQVFEEVNDLCDAALEIKSIISET